MMICKEEDDRGTSDEEEERLFKNKKDNKVGNVSLQSYL
jgi:hypothetical protein